MKDTPKKVTKKYQMKDWNTLSIDDLVLPIRAICALNYLEIRTVNQLLKTPLRKLIMVHNFGRKSWADLLEALRAAGIPEAQIRLWAPCRSIPPR